MYVKLCDCELKIMQLKLEDSIRMTELNNSSFIFDEVSERKMLFNNFRKKNQQVAKKKKSNKNIFSQQPTKPKLTSRLFVNSAKINLNRYWHKLEQLISDTKIIKKNKKKLRKLKSVNQQLLNNRIFPAVAIKQQEAMANNDDEIYGFTIAKFPIKTTTISSSPSSDLITATTTAATQNCKSAYKPFIDDELYHGVNLNAPIPTLMSTSTKLPLDAPFVIDKTSINYNYYLNESQQQQQQQQRPKSYHFNDNAFYIQQLNESLRRKGYKFTLAEMRGGTPIMMSEQNLENEGYLV